MIKLLYELTRLQAELPLLFVFDNGSNVDNDMTSFRRTVDDYHNLDNTEAYQHQEPLNLMSNKFLRTICIGNLGGARPMFSDTTYNVSL